MLINPSSRNQNIIKLLQDFLNFVRIVENTPQQSFRSAEWMRGFHGAIGLAGEGAEVLEIFKKDLFGLNKPIQRERIVDELGDVYWYLTVLHDSFNITMEEVLLNNMSKLSKRYEEVIAAKHKALISDACEAEEKIPLDELEQHANDRRDKDDKG